MQLTDEQKAIIESEGDAKINAVAGSGKTATLIEYAKRRAKDQRILYIAFNRSVRLEAQRRFAAAGLDNVRIETAHSLAYKRTVMGRDLKVVAGYKPHELVSVLGIRSSGRDAMAGHLLAAHISRYAALFCNSATERVADVDYRAAVQDLKAAAFIDRHYEQLQLAVRQFLAKMDGGAVAVTHDFYLKKFQLEKPVLPFDCVLFDEGQDASAVMLDVFLRQAGTKVIVGDAHQQIYSWRHAVNALGKVDFKEYGLTTSFRFPQSVADLAMDCLLWKHHLYGERYLPVAITGAGKPPNKTVSKATLARTNIYLLRAAINLVCGTSRPKKIYFEGNISSYTYAGEGASIWDVYNLFIDNKERIRDPLIARMDSLADLEEYAEEAEDQELSMLIGMVTEHGRELPFYFKRIKEQHVADADKDKADMILSTVHRCKGMEYDWVRLEEDFITEEKVKRLGTKKDRTHAEIDRAAEEINLVYVAVTRSRNHVGIPAGMFDTAPEYLTPQAPETVSSGKSGTCEKEREYPEWLLEDGPRYGKRKGAGANGRGKGGNAPRTGRAWSGDDDALLRSMVARGLSLGDIAGALQRNKGAIAAHVRKLGLAEF